MTSLLGVEVYRNAANDEPGREVDDAPLGDAAGLLLTRFVASRDATPHRVTEPLGWPAPLVGQTVRALRFGAARPDDPYSDCESVDLGLPFLPWTRATMPTSLRRGPIRASTDSGTRSVTC